MGGRAGFSLGEGLDLVGIDETELWCLYLALGGTLTSEGFLRAVAENGSTVDARQHDLIAVALNEAFLELGMGSYPVAMIRPEPSIGLTLRAEAARNRSRNARRRSAELHASASRLQSVAADVLTQCGWVEFADHAKNRADAARVRAALPQLT